MRLIAEIGSNHGGSLERAIQLVGAAAEAGFTDVKTQAWRVHEMFAPDALAARPELLERQRWEVPLLWHPILREMAHELRMGYGITPSSISDVMLSGKHADWLKVSSYSLLDHLLLKAISGAQKPVVASTGMASEHEVANALEALVGAPELTLLHCVSSYPAPAHEANLRSIPHLKQRFQAPVGWSDHTVSQVVVRRAMHVHGAETIEVHWDLDDGAGAEHGHSWTPYTWKKLMETRKSCDDGYYACDGKKGVKAPTVSESEERNWRADPDDGMRPLKAVRATLAPKETPCPQ